MPRQYLSGRGVLGRSQDMSNESMAELMRRNDSVFLIDPRFLTAKNKGLLQSARPDSLDLRPRSPVMSSENRERSERPSALPVELRSSLQIESDRVQCSRRESNYSGLVSLPYDESSSPVEVDIRSIEIRRFRDPETRIGESQDKSPVPDREQVSPEILRVSDQPIDSVFIVLDKSLRSLLAVLLSKELDRDSRRVILIQATDRDSIGRLRSGGEIRGLLEEFYIIIRGELVPRPDDLPEESESSLIRFISILRSLRELDRVEI